MLASPQWLGSKTSGKVSGFKVSDSQGAWLDRRGDILEIPGTPCHGQILPQRGSWLLDGGRQRVGRLEFSLGTSVIAQWNRSEDANDRISLLCCCIHKFVRIEFALFYNIKSITARIASSNSSSASIGLIDPTKS